MSLGVGENVLFLCYTFVFFEFFFLNNTFFFFFDLLFILFIYPWLLGRVGSSLLRAGFLQLRRAGNTLVVVHGLLIVVASLVVEHGL